MFFFTISAVVQYLNTFSARNTISQLISVFFLSFSVTQSDLIGLPKQSTTSGWCWKASKCEKRTSSSVYRALLSTHPFPQWPHWGWAQVKAYLKRLFNTEKRGHIPEPQGRVWRWGEGEVLTCSSPFNSRLLLLFILPFIFFSLSLTLSPMYVCLKNVFHVISVYTCRGVNVTCERFISWKLHPLKLSLMANPPRPRAFWRTNCLCPCTVGPALGPYKKQRDQATTPVFSSAIGSNNPS